MAEKTDTIVCSICLSDFSEPRLIDCHHCFCLRCLVGYVDTFTVDNHFPCPLCRRDITVPAGGVKYFATNFYIKESSCYTGNAQRNQELCDVCKTVNCNFQCADCDKLLCFSCKSTHDSVFGGCNHNVTDLTISVKIPTKPEIPGDHSDSKPTYFCSYRHEKEADVYCKDCSFAMCFRCSVKNHNGHQFVDLSDEQTLQEFCEEFKTIKQDLINQIYQFKNFSDSLEVKVSEVADMADKLCSQVDDQIQKMHDELKSIGENTKIRVNNWRNEETDKLNAVNKEIQIECENVGEIVDNSDDVLENKSFVQIMEILSDIRKEQTKQNQRKLDIPFVKLVKFLEGKINSDILSQQVGILDRLPLEVGQAFCFTTNFNVNQVTDDDVTWKPADGDDVIPWTVRVWRLFDEWLHVDLKLYTITDTTIQHVDVKYRHNLINNNNDIHSVNSTEYNDEISPGGRHVSGYLVNYKTLNNKQNGFLDSNSNFRIQTTITITGLSR